MSKIIFIFLPAEVPVAARVDLQPAEHILFYKKCVLQLIGFQAPRPRRGEGAGSYWTGVDVRPKFHPDQCRGLDIHLPSTYQQRNKHL